MKERLLISLFVPILATIVRSCQRPYYGPNCAERCGEEFTSHYGVIRSPGYETGGYMNEESCDWYIIPDIPSATVIITFIQMDIEYDYDSLIVYEEPPNYSTKVATYYGHAKPYQLMHEAPIRLHFTSDDSVRYNGFHLEYEIFEGIPPRVLPISSVSPVVMKGDDTVLECHVTGVPQPDVTWYKDGLEIQSVLLSHYSVNSTSLAIKNISEYDSGIYKCLAKNHLNSAEMLTSITVHVPPVVVKHPVTIQLENVYDISGIDSDVSAAFYCEVYGIPFPDIYWKKNGILLPHPTVVFDGRSLLISQVSAADLGSYSCFANNTAGSTESNQAFLNIGRRRQCCSPITFQQKSAEVNTGNEAIMSARFDYKHFTLLNISVSLNGYPSTKQLISYSERGYVSISIGLMTDQSDTGVYGWHAYLSPINSTLQKAQLISSYTAVIVKEPPNVTVTPSYSAVVDVDGRTPLACNVEFTYPLPTVSWYEGQREHDSRTRQRSVYIILAPGVWKNATVRHFTCIAYNGVGRARTAVVSLVQRVEQLGGWSWWTESNQCSVTCGFLHGFQIVRRRCLSISSCPGQNYKEQSCLPTRRYCNIGAAETTDDPRPDILANSSTILVDSKEAGVAETTNDPRPDILANSSTILNCLVDSKEADDTHLSTFAVAAISSSLTAVFTIAVMVAFMHCVVKRTMKERVTSSPMAPKVAEQPGNQGPEDCGKYETNSTSQNGENVLQRNGIGLEAGKIQSSHPTFTHGRRQSCPNTYYPLHLLVTPSRGEAVRDSTSGKETTSMTVNREFGSLPVLHNRKYDSPLLNPVAQSGNNVISPVRYVNTRKDGRLYKRLDVNP